MKIRMESEEKRMKSKVRKTISVLWVFITLLQFENRKDYQEDKR